MLNILDDELRTWEGKIYNPASNKTMTWKVFFLRPQRIIRPILAHLVYNQDRISGQPGYPAILYPVSTHVQLLQWLHGKQQQHLQLPESSPRG